ncbi:hypothetical protein XAC439_11830010 [Xanthomonas citri pv. citri]|nr:hypothetical protein XAC439_11830010 [Xanthomonas citri pv. citri]
MALRCLGNPGRISGFLKTGKISSPSSLRTAAPNGYRSGTGTGRRLSQTCGKASVGSN